MKKPYEQQKLSKSADSKIRFRLFRAHLKKQFALLSVSPKLMMSTLVVILVVTLVAPPQLTTYRVSAFVDEAIEVEKAIEMQKENAIYHHKYVVKEGNGKAAYVAKVKGIPLSDAQSVALRHDTIEEWRHGITNLSHIETDVLGEPIAVKLNLENEDHLHVFDFDPQDCAEAKRHEVVSESCEKEADITENYEAHRSVFNDVHDIESLYEADVAHALEPSASISIQKLEFKEIRDDVFVFTDGGEELEIEYHFDEDSHELSKRVVIIHDGEESFEMSEIQEVGYSFVDAGEWETIFDPAKYAFEQLEVIPL